MNPPLKDGMDRRMMNVRNITRKLMKSIPEREKLSKVNKTKLVSTSGKRKANSLLEPCKITKTCIKPRNLCSDLKGKCTLKKALEDDENYDHIESEDESGSEGYLESISEKFITSNRYQIEPENSRNIEIIGMQEDQGIVPEQKKDTEDFFSYDLCESSINSEVSEVLEKCFDFKKLIQTEEQARRQQSQEKQQSLPKSIIVDERKAKTAAQAAQKYCTCKLSDILDKLEETDEEVSSYDEGIPEVYSNWGSKYQRSIESANIRIERMQTSSREGSRNIKSRDFSPPAHLKVTRSHRVKVEYPKARKSCVGRAVLATKWPLQNTIKASSSQSVKAVTDNSQNKNSNQRKQRDSG